MSVVVEKVESLDDAKHRRRKDLTTFVLFTLAAVLGLVASLYVIMFDRHPEALKIAWPAFIGILGLLAGRALKH
ncbi:hypothetical protein XB05_13685 [Xanthomonas arboricola]|nr:hypothetical protein XB05_13685 [Xanthomonas arboricola]